VTIPEETVLDGVNLLPYFLGEKNGAPHDTLYWLGQYKASGAVRKGDWKLLIANSGERAELFQLRNDPAESQDLSTLHPELTAEMLAFWRDFSDRMPPSFHNQYQAAREAYEASYEQPPRALHKIEKAK
jgi:arylsulfatase A-like enzyme